MNAPFSYSAAEPNNVWMQELNESERIINQNKAMRQFVTLYQYVASLAFVQILPTPGNCRLQDLVFVSNLGIVLEHVPDKNTVIISNFTTPPRFGETEVGVNFFKSMGYAVHVAPYTFEGEAELKHLHDNVYIGGYGIRSDLRSYQWMEKEFDMQIIKLHQTDDYLYHLDCTIFPITREQTLVCTEMYTPEEIRAIEKETNIIDVSYDDAYTGITNSVRVQNLIVTASHLDEFKVGTDDYNYELSKNRRLEDIAVELGFDVCYFNISEYLKGGALLSCMIMHLNRKSYDLDLL